MGGGIVVRNLIVKETRNAYENKKTTPNSRLPTPFSLFFLFYFSFCIGVYAQQNATPDGFVRIQGGTFTMGSPANEPERLDREDPQHEVTISGFYMGKYEVTQKEYQEIMGTNPSEYKGDNLPVENVSWYDAVEYCNMRSQKEGLTPAYIINKNLRDPNNECRDDTVKWIVKWRKNADGYRLPTEAEWEYACRAGTTTPFNTGNNITTSQANYNGSPYNNNAEGEYRQKTTPVGSFAPNAWGLYDMHGNVCEWCWDWYGRYAGGLQTDPVGADRGDGRAVRGGGWNYSARYIRSAHREQSIPLMNMADFIGFRLVRPI
jgi:formylglycine-generating enzyme required for sulfatase activity